MKRDKFRADPKDVAVHYQQQAAWFAGRQKTLRKLKQPNAAIAAQRDAAIAAETAMDYLMQHLDARND